MLQQAAAVDDVKDARAAAYKKIRVMTSVRNEINSLPFNFVEML